MVFIIGRSTPLGERLQVSTGKGKATPVSGQKGSRAKPGDVRVGWEEVQAPAGSRLSHLAYVCPGSQQ